MIRYGGLYTDVLNVGDVVPYYEWEAKRWWQFWKQKRLVRRMIRIDYVDDHGEGGGCMAFGKPLLTDS